jgi:hypothetical protein
MGYFFERRTSPTPHILNRLIWESQMRSVLRKIKAEEGGRGLISPPGATHQTLLLYLSVLNPQIHHPNSGRGGDIRAHGFHFVEREQRTHDF